MNCRGSRERMGGWGEEGASKLVDPSVPKIRRQGLQKVENREHPGPMFRHCRGVTLSMQGRDSREAESPRAKARAQQAGGGHTTDAHHQSTMDHVLLLQGPEATHAKGYF